MSTKLPQHFMPAKKDDFIILQAYFLYSNSNAYSLLTFRMK